MGFSPILTLVCEHENLSSTKLFSLRHDVSDGDVTSVLIALKVGAGASLGPSVYVGLGLYKASSVAGNSP